MNDQEFEHLVGNLAHHLGHPPPPITRVEGREDRQCIWLEPPGPVGPMIFVHHHVNAMLPDWVQEYQVAEEFVQANQGIHRHRARVNKVSTVVGFSVAVVGMVVAVRVLHDVVLYLLIGLPIIFALIRVCRTAVWTAWAWWFMRQTDRKIAEVLGWDHLSAVLRWYLDQPDRPDLWWVRRSLRWLKKGAPPTPSDRLRWVPREVLSTTD